MKKEIQSALTLIENANKIALLSHDRPDGDAIGSVVGLGLMLETIGKEVVILNNDGVPATLAFLPCSDKVQVAAPGTVYEVDLIMALDSAGKDRISDTVWNCLPADKPVVNVDHHASNSGFGDINIVNINAPATGEIIFEIAVQAGWPMTREVGENLYAAISTDTGSFRYPNTTANTYRAAAGMIDAGVDVGKINQQLYESFPLRRVECIRDLLQQMKISFGGKCASVRLPLEVKKRLQLGPGDTEGVVDIIRAIDTVIVAVFFEELEGGKIRVSSRSKDLSANVGEICATFGGGGHNLAAGTRMKGPIEEAEARFLEAVGKVL
ncbi:MAG: bifunctional oligoribonuclease/PAP phosphatase NrnA [Verrucomicrobiales bacterium]|nr:bifunctional oligoribonuclease/PAP phosphatase NrnA [Verrucomicrobiales bacterium]